MIAPAPAFTARDHQTWKTLYQVQDPLRETQIVPEFSQGLKALGITAERIPDLAEVNGRLRALTGWEGVYVAGLAEAKTFFEMLAERRFPVGNFIRDTKDLSYTPAPDVFHDLYGHLPFFTIPEYARFCERFAKCALRADSAASTLSEFQAFFWFTIEFGLVKTPAGIRVFGAGIASSFKECAYALSDVPRIHPFDPDQIRRRPFRIDLLQEDLYLLESPAQLYQSLTLFESA